MKRKSGASKAKAPVMTDDIAQRRLLNLEEKFEKLRDKELLGISERLGKVEGAIGSLAVSTSFLADSVKSLQVGQENLAKILASVSTTVHDIHEAIKLWQPKVQP